MGFFRKKNWLSVENSPHTNSPLLRDCYLIDNIEFPFVKAFCDPVLLYQKYVTQELSVGEVAVQVFSSKKTVWKYLRAYKIPIRSDDLAIYEQQRFGTRRVGRRLAASHNELESLEKMKSLRSQGFSYREIVEILNSLKVPTRNRKSKWHVKTVFQILKRELLSERADHPALIR